MSRTSVVPAEYGNTTWFAIAAWTVVRSADGLLASTPAQ